MSDLDLVMQAFNKAQTQGNTEAAKNFAKMALDLDAQFTPAPTPVEREVGIGEALRVLALSAVLAALALQLQTSSLPYWVVL
jgi:hypothetical protein